MKRPALITIVFFLSVMNEIYCQDSLLVEQLKEHIYVLDIVDDDRLQGEGLGILEDAIAQSQFTMIGEQHGIVEVNWFTEYLLHFAQGVGYQHLAIETDPFVAAKLESLADQDIDSLHSFINEYPFTIPFYDNPSGFQLLKKALELNRQNESVFWGLDQVFMAAPRYLMNYLAHATDKESAKKLAEKYLQKGIDGISNAMQSGDMRECLLFQLSEQDFEELHEAFEDNPECSRILREIETTREIYSHWLEGDMYANNRKRSLLMKRQFMEYYNQAKQKEVLPKVLFKFGSNHIYKGLTPVGVFDIGNTVSELAEINGSSSVHIRITGIQGESFNPLQGVQEFDHTDDIDSTVMTAVGERVEGHHWILIDFKALRQNVDHRRLKAIADGLPFNIDFWILIPEAQPIHTF